MKKKLITKKLKPLLVLMLFFNCQNLISQFTNPVDPATLCAEIQPSSKTYGEIMGINFKNFHNVPEGVNMDDVSSFVRYFHLMDGFEGRDYAETFPADPNHSPLPCPPIDINNIDCYDECPGGNMSSMRSRYCRARQEGVNKIYAAIETIRNGNFPNKMFTSEEWGNSLKERFNNAREYGYKFAENYCPKDETKVCLVDILELGNEPWGIPGLTDYQAIFRGIIQGINDYYTGTEPFINYTSNTTLSYNPNDHGKWRIRTSSGAYQYFQETSFNGTNDHANVVPNDLWPYLDAVNIHPYAFEFGRDGNDKMSSYANVLDRHPESRNGLYFSILNAMKWRNENQSTKQLISTEYGWDSQSVGSPTQAIYLVRAMLMAGRFKLDQAVLYEMYDLAEPSNTGLYQTSGLIEEDFITKKESVYAVKRFKSLLGDKLFLDRLNDKDHQDVNNNNDHFAYLVGNSNGTPTHLVVWLPENINNLTNFQTKNITINNLPLNVSINNGSQTIKLNGASGGNETISTNSIVSVNGGSTITINASPVPYLIPLNSTSYSYPLVMGNPQVVVCNECPNPLPPGTICNDNNPNTTNDIIQTDGCTCAGTPTTQGCSDINGFTLLGESMGKGYYKSNEKSTGWNNAKSQSIAAGGNLVSMESQAERDLVDGYISGQSGDQKYFVGLNRNTSGNLVWESGASYNPGAYSPNPWSNGSTPSTGGYVSMVKWQPDQIANWTTTSQGSYTRFIMEKVCTTNDPCINLGGDSDGDGVCDNEDCLPFNPAFPAPVGSTCNDNNPNTTNDIIQTDGCTCAGTPTTQGCSEVDGFTFLGESLGKGYYKSNEKSSGWNNAKAQSQAADGYLVSMESQAERDLIDGYISGQSGDQKYFVGLNRNTSGNLVWESGANYDPGAYSPNPWSNGSTPTTGGYVSMIKWQPDQLARWTTTSQGSYNRFIMEKMCTTSNPEPTCEDISVIRSGNQIIVNNLFGEFQIIKFFEIVPDVNGNDTWLLIEECNYLQDCTPSYFFNGNSNTSYVVDVQIYDTEINCLKRFNVMTGSNLSIPNLITFNAKKNGISSEIDWIMNNDADVDFYEVEVSIDGVNFQVLKSVDAKGLNSSRSYQVNDMKPNYGDNFYRLKIYKLDGNSYYSNTRQLNFDIDFNQIEVYPNPTDKMINILLRDFAGKKGKVEIFNNLGELMIERNYTSLPSIPTQFDVSKFTDGVYFISIKVDGHKRFTKRFIVNKL